MCFVDVLGASNVLINFLPYASGFTQLCSSIESMQLFDFYLLQGIGEYLAKYVIMFILIYR
jgi:hypothetical protein